ncbi:chemotaxis protein CheB [Dyella sp. C11]|uniref:chemotaxis protein CheB n=1 Tax=Dyella sp. C11 TaxID=2126991 RepID=UPI000D652C68|nr:chemotaxis protein CheB [Dyella sp. C11]
MTTTAHIKAVVMGGSAGSIASLITIVRELPAAFEPSVFLTVHVPPSEKRNVLVDVLRSHCDIAIGEAEDKQPIQPGTLYVAPSDYHLLVESSGVLSLSSDEPVLFSRPSIDVLFESAADAYGEALVGIVLSGASSDGAHGSRAIQDAGGAVMVEDPLSAYASVMPLATLNACPGARVGSPGQIATYLKHL